MTYLVLGYREYEHAVCRCEDARQVIDAILVPILGDEVPVPNGWTIGRGAINRSGIDAAPHS